MQFRWIRDPARLAHRPTTRSAPADAERVRPLWNGGPHFHHRRRGPYEPGHDRTLGAGGPTISALGMGCWAIGGPHARRGSPVGWGSVNDDESIRALRRAHDLGVTFFDTADVYGCGHSEYLISKALSKALGDVRDEIVIASKAGYTYVEETREAPGENGDPDYIRWACDESLRRLGTDRIDLYQFHLGGFDLDRAPAVLAVFDELVDAGKVGAIGWSTDDPTRAALFATSPHCKAVQQSFNVFSGNVEVLSLCEERGLASIVRGPLGMGLLTGKFDSTSTPCPPTTSGTAGTSARATRPKPLSASRASARCSPPAAAPWPRAHSPGCGRAARPSCPSPASSPLPRWRRTRARSGSARSTTSR